jgi:hypothetical protein
VSVIVNVSKRSFGAYTRPDVLNQKQPSECFLVFLVIEKHCRLQHLALFSHGLVFQSMLHSFFSKSGIVMVEELNTIIITKPNEPAMSRPSI